MLETHVIDPYWRDTTWLSLVWPNIFPATESEPEPELEETETEKLAETDPVEPHEGVPGKINRKTNKDQHMQRKLEPKI